MKEFEQFVMRSEVALLMREYGPDWRKRAAALAGQNLVSITVAKRALILKASSSLVQTNANSPDEDDVKASEKLE